MKDVIKYLRKSILSWKEYLKKSNDSDLDKIINSKIKENKIILEKIKKEKPEYFI